MSLTHLLPKTSAPRGTSKGKKLQHMKSVSHMDDDEEDADAEKRHKQEADMKELRYKWNEARWKILRNPERALDRIQPYGKLHIGITCARHLPATDLTGGCDGFCKVYLNDEQKFRGHTVWNTRNPVWNLKFEVEVWCPRSILLVKVKDEDLLTSNDFVGFVELPVGDLEPNCAVSGWFELRTASKLDGKATTRMLSHMMIPDGDFGPQSKGNDQRQSEAPGKQTNTQEATNTTVHVEAEELADPNVKSLFSGLICCGGPIQTANHETISIRDAADEVLKAAKDTVTREFSSMKEYLLDEHHKKNAGEIHMSLMLQVPAIKDTPTDQHDEWYAHGFRTPIPKNYKSIDGQPELNLAIWHENLTSLKECIYESLLFPASLIFCYFISWENKCFTLMVLLWWWFVSWLGFIFFLPSVPLFGAFLLFLLRWPSWRAVLLAHESNLKLDYDGFKKVVSWNSTHRVETWLLRFIEEKMKKEVKTESKLHAFAADSFKDLKPVYASVEDLTSELLAQDWIVDDEEEKRMDADGYSYNAQEFKKKHGHNWREHWDVAAKEEGAEKIEPAWTRVPAFLVPDSIEYWIRKYQDQVSDFKKLVTLALEKMQKVGQVTPEGNRAARKAYIVCIGLSLLFLGLGFLVQYVRGLSWFHYANMVTWMVVGTLALLVGGPRNQYIRTYIRASIHHREYCHRRSLGGVRNWAFLDMDTVPQDPSKKTEVQAVNPIERFKQSLPSLGSKA